MWSGRSSQRSLGFVNQMLHDFSYAQNLSDSSDGLSRPNQRFSPPSLSDPLANFSPKAFADAARLVPFAAPFIQERRAQCSPDGAVSDSAWHRNDVVDDFCFHRVLGVGLDDCLLPIIVNGCFFGCQKSCADVDPYRSQHEGYGDTASIIDTACGDNRIGDTASTTCGTSAIVLMVTV
jgi:hypothetical protein